MKSTLETKTETATAAAQENMARVMAPSIDAGLAVLRDWQALMQAGADLISDNVKSAASDVQQFSESRTPAQFGKASAVFSQTLTQRWLDSSKKLAALSAEYANRRMEAGVKLAASAGKFPGKV